MDRHMRITRKKKRCSGEDDETGQRPTRGKEAKPESCAGKDRASLAREQEKRKRR